MKATKWILIFFFLINSIFINKSFAAIQNPTIPEEIKFELINSEYNKYLRRSMRAYTDGELYGEKNIKKKYKKIYKLYCTLYRSSWIQAEETGYKKFWRFML